MKSIESGRSLRAQFNHAARSLEQRVGHWPVWLKMVAFVPILVVLTAVLVAILNGVESGLLALRAAGLHH